MNHAPTLDETAPPPLHRLVEALLFVGGAPLSAARAAEAVRGLTPEGVAEAVAVLNRAYREQGRPYRVRLGARGYEMALRPAFAAVGDRLLGPAHQVRLSQPALDALALVAYRQPVTRQEVDAQRGADSLALLRQLVRLGLVAVQRPGGGQAEACYVTTPRFLRELNLRDLDDLPRIHDLQRL